MDMSNSALNIRSQIQVTAIHQRQPRSRSESELDATGLLLGIGELRRRPPLLVGEEAIAVEVVEGRRINILLDPGEEDTGEANEAEGPHGEDRVQPLAEDPVDAIHLLGLLLLCPGLGRRHSIFCGDVIDGVGVSTLRHNDGRHESGACDDGLPTANGRRHLECRAGHGEEADESDKQEAKHGKSGRSGLGADFFD